MAQQTTVTYLDDIDGSKAAETVAFGLDGAHYEIDLSAKNAKNLRKAVAEFVEHARQIKTAGIAGARTTRGAGRKASSAEAKPEKRADKNELVAIRAWAAENGIEIAARGRISESVKTQYAEAVAAQ